MSETSSGNDSALFAQIERMAERSRASVKALSTAEGWALVDDKNWPGLDWD